MLEKEIEAHVASGTRCQGQGSIEADNLSFFFLSASSANAKRLDIGRIIAEIKRIQNVSLIIIDTLASTFGGYDE